MLFPNVECYLGTVNEDRSCQIQPFVYPYEGRVLSQDALGRFMSGRVHPGQAVSRLSAGCQSITGANTLTDKCIHTNIFIAASKLWERIRPPECARCAFLNQLM